MTEHCMSTNAPQEIEGYIPWCRHCGPVKNTVTISGREAEREAIQHLFNDFADHHKPFVMVVRLEVLRENLVDEKEAEGTREYGRERYYLRAGTFPPDSSLPPQVTR